MEGASLSYRLLLLDTISVLVILKKFELFVNILEIQKIQTFSFSGKIGRSGNNRLSFSYDWPEFTIAPITLSFMTTLLLP